jgi:hypothetical protein
MANFTITGTLRGEAVTPASSQPTTPSTSRPTCRPGWATPTAIRCRSDGAGQAILNAAALALDDYQVYGAPDWWFEVPYGASA